MALAAPYVLFDGELQVVTTNEPYHIASNFITYNNLNIGEGFDEFERYNIIEACITTANNSLTNQQIIDVLAEVGV